MWKRAENDPSSPSPSTNEPTETAPRKASSPPPPKPSSGGSGATIGPSLSVQGTVTGKEDLLIEGKIEGRVNLKENRITVGEQGRVEADLHGAVIEVRGHVQGHLVATQQVLVRASGTVLGNITCRRVSLEDGAKFKGAIDMEPQGEGKGSGGSGRHSGQGSAGQGSSGQKQAQASAKR